ncbi:NAD-dependent epimerase/dehydratase family protein [Pseudomonas sp. GCM10022186]|uniref:NAD-dependent epimerase/dehydratase family protein n=1 Tax=Pseudomonas sp. GCM10022186 TaxID=3252650 RepID=UPI00366C4338
MFLLGSGFGRFEVSLMRILLTGATGFVGRAVMERIAEVSGLDLLVALRRPFTGIPVGVTSIQVGELAADADWKSALVGRDVVVHAAARAHVLNETVADPTSEFRRVNVDGTLALAKQAAAAGVKRFVFISSIGVNGNQSSRPFTEDDSPHPVEPYAVSKLEAEQGLRLLAVKTGMEVVIIRPPLVYGPNAPGNFARLIKLVSKGLPLPFAAVQNKRSLVALDNLVDFILTCMSHPAAANQTFLIADGEDLSIGDLLRRLGGALGKPVRLLPVSAWVLEMGAAVLGRKALYQRLCGSLQVDITKARTLLGWVPVSNVDKALGKTASYYLEHQER